MAMETKSLEDDPETGTTKLHHADMKVIKAMLATHEEAEEFEDEYTAGINREERNVIEKLLLALGQEQ